MNQEVPSLDGLTESKRAIEAMVMVASEPTTVALMAQVLELAPEIVEILCRDLAEEYEHQRRGFQFVEVAGGWSYQTHPDLYPYVERYAMEGIPNRLSSAALETLAIVAYKQPISRARISAIRGVNVDGVLRTLEQRGYVEEIGRDDGPGQAVLFGTTDQFLEKLGLASTADLPPLGDFVPAAHVVEALEQTLRYGNDGPSDPADEELQTVEESTTAEVTVGIDPVGSDNGPDDRSEGEGAPPDPVTAPSADDLSVTTDDPISLDPVETLDVTESDTVVEVVDAMEPETDVEVVAIVEEESVDVVDLVATEEVVVVDLVATEDAVEVVVDLVDAEDAVEVVVDLVATEEVVVVDLVEAGEVVDLVATAEIVEVVDSVEAEGVVEGDEVIGLVGGEEPGGFAGLDGDLFDPEHLVLESGLGIASGEPFPDNVEASAPVGVVLDLTDDGGEVPVVDVDDGLVDDVAASEPVGVVLDLTDDGGEVPVDDGLDNDVAAVVEPVDEVLDLTQGDQDQLERDGSIGEVALSEATMRESSSKVMVEEPKTVDSEIGTLDPTGETAEEEVVETYAEVDAVRSGRFLGAEKDGPTSQRPPETDSAPAPNGEVEHRHRDRDGATNQDRSEPSRSAEASTVEGDYDGG